MESSRVIVAGASRPHPNEQENGDAWSVDWHDGVYRLAVIDGLGHGPEAAAAAAAAVAALRAHPGAPAVEALRLCHRALGGTRGAAATIATIDTLGKRLVYAGVGNVEGRLWRGGRCERPISYRGIVGAHVPNIRPFEFSLDDDWLLLVHTDGIQSRAQPEILEAFRPPAPQALADAVLASWSRASDDATVVVACGSRNGVPASP